MHCVIIGVAIGALGQLGDLAEGRAEGVEPILGDGQEQLQEREQHDRQEPEHGV